MKVNDKVRITQKYDLLGEDAAVFYGKTGVLECYNATDNRWSVKLDEPLYIKFLDETNQYWAFIATDLEPIES